MVLLRKIPRDIACNPHIKLPFSHWSLPIILFFAKNILVRNCCLCVGVGGGNHFIFMQHFFSVFLFVLFLIPSSIPWVEAINFRLYITLRKLCRSPIVTRNRVFTLCHYVSYMRVTDSSRITGGFMPFLHLLYTSAWMLSSGSTHWPSSLTYSWCSPKPKPPSLCGHQLSNVLYSLSYLLNWINYSFLACRCISGSLAHLLACLLIVYSMFI